MYCIVAIEDNKMGFKKRVVSPTVTVIEHRKIKPKAKHFSHCKKDQSSWPNQKG